MSDYGIENAVVDVKPSRTLFRYELPKNKTLPETRFYALSAATRETNSSTIVVEVHHNDKKIEEMKVDREDVEAYMNDEIDHETLNERIKEKKISREESEDGG